MNKITNLLSIRKNFQSIHWTFFKNYGSERKKNPHVAKSKDTWTKRSNQSKYVKSETISNREFMNANPVDPVWLISDYQNQKFEFTTIMKFHRELAQQSMFNNLNSFVSAKFILDMRTKKKGKYADNIKFNVKYPYDFPDGMKKEVIAISKNDNEINSAKDAGALYAGYDNVLKMFERGEITDASYDVIVCTPEVLNEIILLKKKINKDRIPSLKSKTVGENLSELVSFFRSSKLYESIKINDETGCIKANFGRLDMDDEKLENNLKELITCTLLQAKIDKDSFIKNCSLFCAPSIEMFQIDLRNYVPGEANINDSEKSET